MLNMNRFTDQIKYTNTTDGFDCNDRIPRQKRQSARTMTSSKPEMIQFLGNKPDCLMKEMLQ